MELESGIDPSVLQLELQTPTGALAPDSELLDEVPVAGLVHALQVVEEVAAVLDLAQQAVTRAVVLLVRLEMLGEGLDLLRENRDLDFAGSRITVMTLVFVLDGGLVDLHGILFFLFLCSANREAVTKQGLRFHSKAPAPGINLLRQSQIRAVLYQKCRLPCNTHSRPHCTRSVNTACAVLTDLGI